MIETCARQIEVADRCLSTPAYFRFLAGASSTSPRTAHVQPTSLYTQPP